jgi:hypothetical protein
VAVDALVGARAAISASSVSPGPALDTILVDQEIVAVIRAQQEWVSRFRAGLAAPAPKYLFLAARKNRSGDRPT